MEPASERKFIIIIIIVAFVIAVIIIIYYPHSDLKEQMEAALERITKVTQCQIGYVNNPTDPLSGYGISGQEIGVAFKHSFKVSK